MGQANSCQIIEYDHSCEPPFPEAGCLMPGFATHTRVDCVGIATNEAFLIPQIPVPPARVE
jgi:hypothetical protein